jgi:dTDP-4-dehydrorhamnose 3,5-epimerase
MNVIHTRLSGVMLIEPNIIRDKRGFFIESYSEKKAFENGIRCTFIQDNHSCSHEAGVLRGLHYQLNPYAQNKLIRVTSGAIYDVAVDIRRNSPTFGQWQGCILSSSNHRQLLIPAGFAHGFCTLVPNTEVQYKVDAVYAPEYERGIAWNDPGLDINWPVTHPILSDKDGKHPNMADAELNYIFEG